MSRSRTFARLAVATFVVTGCVAERSFPEPAQMCENLVSICGSESIEDFPNVTECFEIGRAGVANPRDEDQCFAVHDECVSDCEYWALVMSFYDAGAEASGAPDGATEPRGDAAASDAAGAEPVSDASTAE